MPAAHRRKGYGRFLVSEVLRRARENHVDLVAVQTDATNAPALALYASLGFERTAPYHAAPHWFIQNGRFLEASVDTLIARTVTKPRAVPDAPSPSVARYRRSCPEMIATMMSTAKPPANAA